MIKNSSYTEKYQHRISCSFTDKVVCLDNKFSKKVVLYRGKNAVYKFIEAVLKEYDYCKKMIKKHFDKNLKLTKKIPAIFHNLRGYASRLIVK